MRTTDLLKDSVFQLNLLLWMAKQQPSEDYRVRPFFCEQGFDVVYIENPFNFPEEYAKVVRDCGIEISANPEPEMILGRDRDKRALYFEAKANSFGLKSKNCKQALGNLAATGKAFGEVFSPLKSCLLCYLLPDGKRQLMSNCLTVLSDQLEEAGVDVGRFSCHELAFREQKIFYSWDDAFKSHLTLTENEVSVLENVSEDTSPAPLVLVFSDEDCPDEYNRDFYRRVVIEQVRARLLCDLRPIPLGSQYVAITDKLLDRTSEGFFQYMSRERQRSLSRLVQEHFLKKISEHWKDKQPNLIWGEGRLTISWNNIEGKDEFLGWLEKRQTEFDTGRPKPEEISLFSGLDTPDDGVEV